MKIKELRCASLLICIYYLLQFGGNIQAQENLNVSVPDIIAFNGFLTDNQGNELPDGKYDFIFSLYNSSESKTPLWTEEHNNILVKNGEFQALLGSNSLSSLSTLLFDTKYYLGIKIDEDDEMPERFEFVSIPYSLAAKYANTVSDGSITTEKLVDRSITNDQIKSVNFGKIINIPNSLGSLTELRTHPVIQGSDYEWWTTFGNLIWGPERHFIGTRNERNFVIQTHEIQRMLFDPYGYVVLGTVQDSVDFEVIGKSTFVDAYIKGRLGVGIWPPVTRMQINSETLNPFRVDYQSTNLFEVDIDGRVVINSSVSGSDSDINNYPLLIDGVDQGIAITVDGGSNGDHNYMSFWDDGGMVGRIEGQTAGEYALEPMSIATDIYFVAKIAAEVVAAAAWAYPLPIPLEPADIIAIAADLAEIVFVSGWELGHTGITYESASGDYAEWLERCEDNEIINVAEIVGVYGGKITKNTSGADNYMVISTSPIILGNTPKRINEPRFEKVAFMGQVPVKIRGKTNEGDYIIPSGQNDGSGIAVSPELMTVEEYSKIIGRAWSSSDNESLKLINVLVGFDSRDLGNCLTKLRTQENNIVSRSNEIDNDIKVVQKEVNKYQSEFEEIENKLDDIYLQLKKHNMQTKQVLEGSYR